MDFNEKVLCPHTQGCEACRKSTGSAGMILYCDEPTCSNYFPHAGHRCQTCLALMRWFHTSNRMRAYAVCVDGGCPSHFPKCIACEEKLVYVRVDGDWTKPLRLTCPRFCCQTCKVIGVPRQNCVEECRNLKCPNCVETDMMEQD